MAFEKIFRLNMKALILAAGYGTRMRPLTLHIPKPLLKVGQHSLIEHHIIKLQQAGIHNIVINLSYLGDHIKQALGDGSAWNTQVTYSEEGDTPLGIGGAIIHALALLGKEPFILVSSDIFSDFPIHSLLDKTQHVAHMVMVNNPDFHQDGDYGITHGYLTKSIPKYTYAGYSVWHPHVFEHASTGKSIGIKPFIDHILKTESISAELFSGYYVNVGTPEQLAELNNQLRS